MKLLFALIILIFTIIQSSSGQTFDYGRIVSKNGGLCLTLPFQGQAPKVSACGSVDKQVFTYNIGALGQPTFIADDLCLTSPDNINVIGGPNNLNDQTNQWSIRNTGDNDVIIINNNNRRCLNHYISPTGDSTVTIEPCATGSIQQLFTFQSTNSAENKVTFNSISVPLTMGLFLDALGINGPPSSYQGLNYPVAGYSLRLDDDCVLRVRSQGQLLWKSSESYSGCTNSAYIKVSTTGNVCIYPGELNDNAVWCTGTSGTEGRYLTLIPPYSYGRQFGLVLLNSAQQIVWARFGAPQIYDAAYILIPGNYIDKLNPTRSTLTPNHFITNGRDYLFLQDDGRLKLQSTFIGGPIRFITHVPTSSEPAPYTFGPNGDKFCLQSGNGNLMECTDNGRYVQVPVFDSLDVTHWGFVTLDNGNSITGGFFNLPTISNEYVENSNVIINGIHTNAIDLSILEGGAIKVTVKLINKILYPTITGQLLHGRDCDPSFEYWHHQGVWNSDNGFSFANVMASTLCHQGGEVKPYLTYFPGASDNTFLVAGTIFPEIFMLNGDGKINFHIAY